MVEAELINKIEFLHNFEFDKSQLPYTEYEIAFKEAIEGVRNFPRQIVKSQDLEPIRCRKISSIKEVENISQLWYPRNNNDWKLGRLNDTTSPILYTSDNARTACFEVKPNKGQLVAFLNFSINTPDIFCTRFLDSDVSIFSTNNNDKIIYEFLIKEFKKQVPENQYYLYFPTIILAKRLSPTEANCIVYESVATKFNGINYAFKPAFINDKWIFKSARLCEVLEVDEVSENYTIRCLKIANSETFGVINWEDSPPCNGHELSNHHN